MHIFCFYRFIPVFIFGRCTDCFGRIPASAIILLLKVTEFHLPIYAQVSNLWQTANMSHRHRWTKPFLSWWRYAMETFSALLALFVGNSPVTSEFPSQRPVTRSFDVFFDLRLNKRLSKQSWGWWFETPSRPLWRHRNDHSTVCRRNKASVYMDTCYFAFVILYLSTVYSMYHNSRGRLQANP